MVKNVVLFQGVNSSDKFGLWETDGTVGGTFEIVPITGANASGLTPSNLIAFNGEILFEGKNASGSGQFGLWVTDGTGSGTKELTVQGANSGGLSPNNLTVFEGRVLLSGQDSAGKTGLWTTNGLTGGTSEVVAGTASGG